MKLIPFGLFFFSNIIGCPKVRVEIFTLARGARACIESTRFIIMTFYHKNFNTHFWAAYGNMGHSRKHPYLAPPQRKLEAKPPTSFGCPNTLTIIIDNCTGPIRDGHYWTSREQFRTDRAIQSKVS